MKDINRREFVKTTLAIGSATLFTFNAVGLTHHQNEIRVRRDVGELSDDDIILQTYRRGVDLLKKLPKTDFRNWDNLAKVHLDFCPHGNWFFLPWHRAYLHSFENIIREITNSPEFALPYWDWTKDTQIPSSFWKDTLNDASRQVTQNDTISPESTGTQVIADVMREKKFELFGSTKPFNQTSTDTRFQRARGALSLLERTPHNDVHNWINGNMASMLSPIDPIFWLHHCNVDRIWADWNSKGNSNTSDQLWRDFTFRQNFVLSKDKRYDVIVKNLEDTIRLGYRYHGINPVSDQVLAIASTPFLETNFQDKFASMRAAFSKLGQESVFPVELSDQAVSKTKNLRTDLVTKGEQPRVLAIVKNVDPGTASSVRVRVFLDCDYLSQDTPPNDPHYVGSLSFFGASNDHTGHHGMDKETNFSYIFDLTKTLEKLDRLNRPIEKELNVQLLPLSFAKGKTSSAEIKFDGVEIILV